MRIKIKQVPDNDPNAEGVWIERDVEEGFFAADYRAGQTRWERLTKLCDPGHHAVSYYN